MIFSRDDHRFAVQIVLEEKNARFSGLLVEGFPLAIGSDIPIKNIHPGIGIFFFKGHGAFNGMGAAHFGAIGMIFIP